jgi:hypothetical protein
MDKYSKHLISTIGQTAFSVDDFDYDKETRMFSQDISMLAHGCDNRPVFCKIYPVSCDLGLVLINHKTGNETKWAVDGEDRDGDNEISGWRLVPTAETIRKFPRLIAVTMLIVND